MVGIPQATALPRSDVNPNRISSSGYSRPDRFKLDRRPRLVRGEH